MVDEIAKNSGTEALREAALQRDELAALNKLTTAQTDVELAAAQTDAELAAAQAEVTQRMADGADDYFDKRRTERLQEAKKSHERGFESDAIDEAVVEQMEQKFEDRRAMKFVAATVVESSVYMPPGGDPTDLRGVEKNIKVKTGDLKEGEVAFVDVGDRDPAATPEPYAGAVFLNIEADGPFVVDAGQVLSAGFFVEQADPVVNFQSGAEKYGEFNHIIVSQDEDGRTSYMIVGAAQQSLIALQAMTGSFVETHDIMLDGVELDLSNPEDLARFSQQTGVKVFDDYGKALEFEEQVIDTMLAGLEANQQRAEGAEYQAGGFTINAGNVDEIIAADKAVRPEDMADARFSFINADEFDGLNDKNLTDGVVISVNELGLSDGTGVSLSGPGQSLSTDDAALEAKQAGKFNVNDLDAFTLQVEEYLITRLQEAEIALENISVRANEDGLLEIKILHSGGQELNPTLYDVAAMNDVDAAIVKIGDRLTAQATTSGLLSSDVIVADNQQKTPPGSVRTDEFVRMGTGTPGDL